MKFNKDGTVKVMMPKVGVDALRSHLLQSQAYLELGSGGSTVLAAECNVPYVCAVETHKEWLEGVVSHIDKMSYTGTLNGVFVDIGPTGNCGRPVDKSMKDNWPAYQTMPYMNNTLYDLVLVDGRFRTASFCTAFLVNKPGTVVLFDDYVGRHAYHKVEQFAKPVEFFGRMAKFVIPEEFDRDVAKSIQQKSLYIYG